MADPCAVESAFAPVSAIHERLLADLFRLAGAPLRLVVAPAGYGKTTLLRQLAARTATGLPTRPVWYAASAAEVSPPAFVRKLAHAFGSALGTGTSRITQFDTLTHRLRNSDRDFTVFVDNADRLAGRPSSVTLTDLIARALPNVHFVVASRSLAVPALSRLESVAPLFRLGHQDLRFRTWQTEALFRDIYHRPLAPEVAATLCARMEGWPAALHAFHVDTMLSSDADRERAARGPLWNSPQIRDYLAKIVLRPLPEDVREFLLHASALGVLSGSLCDRLLDRSDSAVLLRKLCDNQILTWPCERDGARYRFHLLLQQYLEGVLADRFGPARTREWYETAASCLVQFEHWPEAYRAYARAGNWMASAEILHHEQVDHGGLADAAVVPRALIDTDPWIAFADARRRRADGRLAEADAAYLAAEAGFTEPGMRWRCAVERASVARWRSAYDRTAIDEDTAAALPSGDAFARLFDAVHGHPSRLLILPGQPADPEWGLVRGLAAVLDGQRGLANALLRWSAGTSDSFVSLASRIALATMAALANRPDGNPATFTVLALEAETSGWPWLARMARAARTLADPTSQRDAFEVQQECLSIGDQWGALVAGVLHAASTIRAGADPRRILRDAIAQAGSIGATVPEIWLWVMLVDQLTRDGDPDAELERPLLVAAAEQVGLYRAVTHGAMFIQALRCTRPRTVIPTSPDGEADPGDPLAPEAVGIRCLGDFEFDIGGRPLDLNTLRPQARTMLRILSLHAGSWVHEEKLIDAVWPSQSASRVRHRLHVAISSLRSALRLPAGPDLTVDIVRRDDGYLLRLPAGSQVDVTAFRAAARRWRGHGGSVPREVSVEWGYRALRLYRGELLNDDGSVEWALLERDQLRTEAAAIAVELAEWEIGRGDIAAAVRVCQRGLRIDELSDQLWHLLATAQQRIGNQAAARRALRAYHDLLAENLPESSA